MGWPYHSFDCVLYISLSKIVQLILLFWERFPVLLKKIQKIVFFWKLFSLPIFPLEKSTHTSAFNHSILHHGHHPPGLG